MAKYTPLGTHLRAQGSKEVTLSFADIERIIAGPLPPSARNHGEWWANDSTGSHPHANAWLTAGWQVDGFSLTERWARFIRTP